MKFQFHKFPYIDAMIALEPLEATKDLEKVLEKFVNDEQSAAFVLQRLVDSARKAGLQVFVKVENPESALPEAHRLTYAIFSLDQNENIYFTPKTTGYESSKLFNLFGK